MAGALTDSTNDSGFFSGLTLRGLLEGVAEWDVAKREAEKATVVVSPTTANQPSGNAGTTATDYTDGVFMGYDKDTLMKTALGVAVTVVAAGVAIYIFRKVV